MEKPLRFSRVLLVSPPSSSRYGGLRVPAGIGYIAQALFDRGIEYEYVDMRTGLSFGELMKRASSFRPDLIGVSMITLEYKTAYRMISRLKELLPKSRIVVGGHHVTVLKEDVLNECKEIDFGVVSDGERTIVELCLNAGPVEEIKGLISRKNGQVVYSGDRPPVGHLDDISFPRYHKFDMRDYSKQIPIHSSRGCVYKCTFCPNRVLLQFRTRSPKNFVDEIEYWHGRGIRQFAIDDDNFTLNNKRVYDICDEIERRGLTRLLIRCSNGIRADRTDRRLLERMKEIGVREVGFGVDGGNDKVLTSLKKGETIETIERAIRDACEIGLDVKLFFLTGSPHETEADIEDSIRLARKYPVAKVNFNNLIPYPGTEIFDYIKSNNLFLIPPEDYLNGVSEEKPVPVFETPELPREKRIGILTRCKKVEEEVMKNTALRRYGNYPIVRPIIKHFFHVPTFEKLFFKNLTIRKLLENIRYRKLLNI